MLSLLLFAEFSTADGDSRSGTFEGLSNHITADTAIVVKTDSGYIIKLGEDFTFDGTPDPKVALGKDGKYDPATLIQPLQSNSGAQSYEIPASTDPADYNKVYIWCEKYSVGLGVASIK